MNAEHNAFQPLPRGTKAHETTHRLERSPAGRPAETASVSLTYAVDFKVSGLHIWLISIARTFLLRKKARPVPTPRREPMDV